MGDLTPTRDFNYVADTCRGFIALAKAEGVEGQEINICTNSEISMQDTLQLIADIMKSDVRWVQDEARMRPSNSEVFRLRVENSTTTALTVSRPLLP